MLTLLVYAHNFRRHAPRKRAIQYSEPFVAVSTAGDYWIARSSRTMTVRFGYDKTQYAFSFLVSSETGVFRRMTRSNSTDQFSM